MKRNVLTQYLIITASCALYAVGFNWMFDPNHISVGGFTGLGQIINYLLPGLPIGTIVIILNVPLFVLGWRFIGKDFLFSSVYATAVSSLMIDGLAAVHTFKPMEPILACLYGGVIIGVSCGIMLREGVLTSYLHDRISARHYGVNPTGNGRRDTFRNVPIPRMRATYMEAGNMKEADIISTVKNGIFVDTFTNGQVQIGAGDFTFFVKSGYLIEDGKLTQPVKDINIIGNGPKALADITMVADNDRIDNGTWTCGKDGQSCPVTCGMPSALVSKLTVGGEN